jgi:hypothetical protein
MAGRVLRLQMDECPPAMEGSCEYIKYAAANKRQWAILQIEEFGVGLTTLLRKK